MILLSRSPLDEFRLLRCLVGCLFVTPPQDQNQRADTKEGNNTAEPHDIDDDRAIASRSRVVMEAVEQQLIDGRADLVVGSLDQPEPQVSRVILDAIKV